MHDHNVLKVKEPGGLHGPLVASSQPPQREASHGTHPRCRMNDRNLHGFTTSSLHLGHWYKSSVFRPSSSPPSDSLNTRPHVPHSGHCLSASRRRTDSSNLCWSSSVVIQTPPRVLPARLTDPSQIA